MEESNKEHSEFIFDFPEINGTDLYDVGMINKLTGEKTIISMRIHSEKDMNQMRTRLNEIREEAIKEREEREEKQKEGKGKIKVVMDKVASVLSYLVS